MQRTAVVKTNRPGTKIQFDYFFRLVQIMAPAEFVSIDTGIKEGFGCEKFENFHIKHCSILETVPPRFESITGFSSVTNIIAG